MNADGTLNVAGGKHLDGKVEASGGHPDWSAPATHGQHFFAYLRGTVGELNCTTCHGATFDGGLGPSCTSCHSNTAGWTADWRTNCSFCHGTRNATTKTTPYSVATSPTLSAPPDALSQRLTGVADPTRSGAHQAHLTGKGSGTGTTYSAPIACGTCHTVPADYQHAGGPGRAPVVLKGLSGSLPASLGSYSADSGTCTTYCHGATMANPTPPAWNGGELGCTGCHGNPPLTGQHDYHVNQMGYWCADCHTNSVTYPPPYIGVKHLNGKVDVDFYSAYLPASKYSGGTCSTVTCHPFSYPVTW
jgi:predicted CxxxxCH...CXXCH cytochrome family protein